MNIGIIGAGKVGCSIGKYLQDSSAKLNGYYSRTNESAEFAANFTNSRAYGSLEELLRTSDTLFIATPDGEISNLWDCIVEALKKEQKIAEQIKYICHFSGSLSSDLFLNRNTWNIQACSIHPMYAFSNKENSYLQLNQAVFTVEGDQEAIETIGRLFREKGNVICRIQTENKMKYHAAAAMLSNLNVGLISMSMKILYECGFSEEQAMQVAAPLVRNNIENTLKNGVVQALTGPIERNDIETVKKHLAVLEGDFYELYKILGRELIEISKRKYPNRDYCGLMRMMQEGEIE